MIFLNQAHLTSIEYFLLKIKRIFISMCVCVCVLVRETLQRTSVMN